MPSDIQPDRLIFRKTPEKLHPYIKLARLDRPIGIWLLLFPCWWAIVLASDGVMNMRTHAWILMALMTIGATLMRSAGCIVNDLLDRNLDASVARTKNRPLASGDISVRNALKFLAGLLAASFLILIQLSHQAIILGVLSLGLVAAYPKMKQITWWPQLFLGLTFNWGALLGWAAATGQLSRASTFMYIGGIFWTLAYDTIYAHQDAEDDALVGIKSTARLFGDASPQIVIGCYILSAIFLLLAKYAEDPNIITPLLSAIPMFYMIWRVIVWDMKDPESCLATFKQNQIYGWLMLVMFAI